MKRKTGYIKKKIGTKNVILPFGQNVIHMNGIITLNESASFLWELLSEDRLDEELINAIVNQFDVDFKTASKDVGCFIIEMTELGLLES